MGLFDRLRKRGGSGRKANEIELENLKDEVRNLTERARDKKREYDKETSKHMRGIVAGELTLILDELDARKDRERIIARNLRQAALTERKRSEAEVARKKSVSEEEMDEVALDYEDAVAEMKDADLAAKELEKVVYEPEQEKEPVFVERMAKMDMETERKTKEPEAREPETGTPVVEDEMSEETRNRLKELDLE